MVMDNTIIEFPQKGLRNGNKVAKLSTVKRDKLVFKYKTTLEEYRNKNNNVNTTNINSEPAKQDINVLDNIIVVDFANLNNKKNGTRKLKVSEVVTNKSRRFYEKNAPKIEAKVAKPVVEETKSVEPSFSTTRMSRLERTGEINKIDIKEEPRNNIINTPERFMEKEPVNPYESLINDKEEQKENAPLTRESIHSEEKNSEQNMGGDPNLYTKLVHGKDDGFAGDEISAKLQDAISKLGVANEEREKAKAVNASLEAEVANVRETLERIKKEKEAQEQIVLENTLSMLKDAKAEILDETRRYDNLQEELKALIKERDALLKSTFVNKDEDYSTKKVA